MISELALWTPDEKVRALEANAAYASTIMGAPPFIPDTLKVKNSHGQLDTDATHAIITAVLLAGEELGLPPMASLRSFVIVRGVPCLYAQTYRALVQRDGHSIVVKASTPNKAIVEVRDRVTHEPMQAVWDLDRARRAKITGFTHPDGPWQRQPQNMLLARATAEAARWVASDALLGLYVAEELQDSTQTAEPPPAPVGAQVPQRQRAVRRRTNPPPAITHNGPLPPPPAKGTDDTPLPRGRAENTAAGPDQPAAQEPDGQPAEHPPGETSTGNPPPGPAAITDNQRRKMYAILKKIGLGDKEQALDKISEWIGRAVLSTSELTEQEASIVIATISVIEQDQAAQGGDDASA